MANLEKMTKRNIVKKTAKKSGLAHVYKETGEEEYYCEHCEHSVSVYVVHFDSKMARTLEWMYKEYIRTESPVIGITKKQNKLVPDWIVGDRIYSKLKYWGFVIDGGVGKYEIKKPELVHRFISGSLNSKGNTSCVPSSCQIAQDEVLGYSLDTITFDEALGVEFNMIKLEALLCA